MNELSDAICSEVRKICHPVLDKLGITFFDYARMYDDGSCYVLANNSDVMSYLFRNEAPLFTPVEHRLLKKKIYYLVPDNGPYQKVMQDARQYFNVAHAIDLFQCHRGYVDVCCFASTAHNEAIINYYLNHIDVLENFMAYFRNAASGLIGGLNRSRIILPKHMRLNFDSRSVFTDQIGVNLLTGRETDIARLITRGKTANEIALTMRRSRRTIEHHIANIKEKLGVCTKSDLIEKLLMRNQFNSSWFEYP